MLKNNLFINMRNNKLHLLQKDCVLKLCIDGLFADPRRIEGFSSARIGS